MAVIRGEDPEVIVADSMATLTESLRLSSWQRHRPRKFMTQPRSKR